MKKIATIIVTYNGEKWIERCLETLQKSNYPSEIFVADNLSTDNTLSLVKKYPVHLRVLDFNSGFGYANNLILKELQNSDFDYFFLLNQDVYIEKDTLEKLVDFAENRKNFGIVAPVQFDGKGEKIDANFQQYINLSKDKVDYYVTDFCNAAAWLISKECLLKVGIFNENFRHYGEDRNYCNRVQFHNFEIAILKDAKVSHDRFQDLSKEKSLKLAKIKILVFS